ncbi:MAG: hypothetical protein KatS3mg113_0878 [Planctomycetaceae bacterium]|nr:MAG: hypothetical protein KatS3mg113_0878 [Planctomycetaceae bacterium]
MKLFNFCGAVAVALSLTNLADAGLFSSLKTQCGAEKGCGCAPTCQPARCKPVIAKPCQPNVYTYQRKCSDIKPPCCNQCAPNSCAPAHRNGPGAQGCAAPAACGPAAAPACAAPSPAACGPAAAPACAAPAPAACGPAAAPACAAPSPAACGPAAAPACAAPASAACGPAAAPACAAPASQTCTPATNSCGCKKSHGLLHNLLHRNKHCNACAPAPSCAAPVTQTCCQSDACEIAQLIYESQTACYAKDRRRAISKLGNRYDCVCNPEIMSAFIVALNDCDERVRREAADEIGDQIRKHPCCCSAEVVAALTCALADCDKQVVRQATQALRLCGYDVVEGNCHAHCAPACGANGCAPTAPANGNAAPAPAPAPAPVPPEGNARRTGLSQLLGLLD